MFSPKEFLRAVNMQELVFQVKTRNISPVESCVIEPELRDPDPRAYMLLEHNDSIECWKANGRCLRYPAA